jgi:L-malate glycosyltransferase
MKVLLLSDTYSEHTEKWALGLADAGIEIGLFSFNKASYEWYNHPRITVFFEPERKINAESTLTKLAYLKYVSILKKIIRHFKPDILHAHYASSYGLVGALSGFHPFVLSVWGSDIYDFPKRSKLHKRLIQHNLRKADMIMSTSQVMREEIAKYSSKPVVVTPFGVDTQIFKPSKIAKHQAEAIYIGTIKPIEEKYGIETILQAAKMLHEAKDGRAYRFMLVGAGNDLERYRGMVKEMGLESCVEITGRIPFSRISEFQNLLDIFLNVSIYDSESFGVAAVEAMACEKPVIVSDVGGLREVVGQGEFGKVIPRKDPQALAAAILGFLDDKPAAEALGKKARQHVLAHYDWKNNLGEVIKLYQSLLVPAEPDSSKTPSLEN